MKIKKTKITSVAVFIPKVTGTDSIWRRLENIAKKFQSKTHSGVHIGLGYETEYVLEPSKAKRFIAAVRKFCKQNEMGRIRIDVLNMTRLSW